MEIYAEVYAVDTSGVVIQFEHSYISQEKLAERLKYEHLFNVIEYPIPELTIAYQFPMWF
jgi:hypothetical protein